MRRRTLVLVAPPSAFHSVPADATFLSAPRVRVCARVRAAAAVNSTRAVCSAAVTRIHRWRARGRHHSASECRLNSRSVLPPASLRRVRSASVVSVSASFRSASALCSSFSAWMSFRFCCTRLHAQFALLPSRIPSARSVRIAPLGLFALLGSSASSSPSLIRSLSNSSVAAASGASSASADARVVAASFAARCSHTGCDAAVSHFCPDCGELCSVHERKRHSLPLLQSHIAATVPIAQKSATLLSKLAHPATVIRAQARRAMRRQEQVELAEAEASGVRLQAEHLERQLQAKMKVLEVLKQTAGRMDAADDSAVLEIEADRLEATKQTTVAVVSAHRPHIDSAILNALRGERVADLQTFLGDARPLSNAKLIYRGSRDGFKADDWWRLCGGRPNLLTIIKVKRNGFVYGAFTPFRWPRGPGERDDAKIADPSGTTFLFSLVNDHNRAVKLSLKEDRKERAGLSCHSFGPSLFFLWRALVLQSIRVSVFLADLVEFVCLLCVLFESRSLRRSR